MTVRYKKSPHARAQTIAGQTFLLRTDSPAAFELNESGAVLWEALDHFEDREDFEALIREARPDLSAEDARELVGQFFVALADHGLVTVSRSVAFRKNLEVTIEQVGNELMVLSRADRKVHLLNDTAALLWGALDHFRSADELAGLLAEAWPAKSPDEIETIVQDFVSRLFGLGLLAEDA